MEIAGYNEEGNFVKADFGKFATDNAMPNEDFYGIGSTKAHARYKNRDTGEFREVDLRQLASAGGLANPVVNFRSDNDTGKQWVKREKIDQGVAYNLERIKTDEGKRMYLQEKGYQSFFNEGDDYYAIKDGYVVPINNEEGLDLSDFTRLGAHAGRDLGAATGVALTGVGAAATGGASLLAAGAAGTAGAVAGETIQRGLDKAFGADADKYNAMMSASEEGMELLSTAGIGAAQGLGGQYLSKGAGFLKTKGMNALASQLAETKAGEFMANAAARSESGYLMSQLPSGFMQKVAGSSEEARAAELLKTTLKENGATDVLKAANAEAKAVIRGAAKPTAEQVAESQSHQTLTKMAMQKQAQIAESEESQIQATEFRSRAKDEFTTKFRESHYENAKDFYKGSKIDVDEVFRDGGDLAKTEGIVRDAEKELVGRLKAMKIDVVKDDAGRAIGVDEGTINKVVNERFHKVVDDVGAKVDKMSQSAFRMDKFPVEQDRAMASGEVLRAIQMVEKGVGPDTSARSETLESLRFLKEVIDNHTSVSNQDDVAHAFRKFTEVVRMKAKDDSLPPSAHAALEHANNAMFNYAGKLAKDSEVLFQAQRLQTNALALNKLVRNEIHGEDGGVEFMLTHFDAAAKQIGFDSQAVSDLAFAHNAQAMLAGTNNKAAWKFLSDQDRQAVTAFMGVRNWDKLGIKKVSKSPEKSAWKQLDEALSTNVLTSAPYVTGKIGVQTTGKVTKAAAKGAKAVADVPFARRTAQYFGIAGAEEAVVNTLQRKYAGKDKEY